MHLDEAFFLNNNLILLGYFGWMKKVDFRKIEYQVSSDDLVLLTLVDEMASWTSIGLQMFLEISYVCNVWEKVRRMNTGCNDWGNDNGCMQVGKWFHYD